MTFKSAVDPWTFIPLVICALLAAALVAGAVLADAKEAYILIPCAALVFFLPVWPLFNTSYQVDEKALRIRSGPTSWRVDLSSIQSVRETRSLIAAPALSLQRLEIEYGTYRQKVLVSPADREGFLQAIGHSVSA